MIETLVKIFGGGVLIILGLKFFNYFFGGYLGFIVYHVNFSVFFTMQYLLDISTIKYYVFAIVFILILSLFKTIKKVISG